MMRRLVSLCATLIVLAAPGAAHAHGDIQSTDPEDGSRVRTAPSVVRISFTEAPTADSHFEVQDGCGQDVLTDVGGEGPNAELSIEENYRGTGKWTVSYRVISSADGHLTKGSFSFRVGDGPVVCRDNDSGIDPRSPSPDIGDAGPPVIPAEPSNPSSFPVGPVLAGVGIVALAVAVRVLSSR